jgi:hypothetical protein
MSAEEKELIGAEIKVPNVNKMEMKDSGLKEIGGNDQEVAYNNPMEAKASIAPMLDGASNMDAIGIIEKLSKENPDQKEEVKVLFPKLFIKKEELIEVEVEVLFDPSNGEVYSITQPGLLNTQVLNTLKATMFNFKFKPVTYDDVQRYRKQASFYDAQVGELIINRMTLRSLFMINHLRETDLVDENGEPFEIELDEATDNLSLSTINKLYETVPALLDVVMTLFERKLLVLFNIN